MILWFIATVGLAIAAGCLLALDSGPGSTPRRAGAVVLTLAALCFVAGLTAVFFG